MDVHDRPLYLRSAVLLVLFLLHGGLIFVFVREKPGYRDHRGSAEVLTTIFFINAQPRLALPPLEVPRTPRRRTGNLQHRLPPDTAISSLDTNVPPENQRSVASPGVDWLAEAHRSASDIASREGSAGAAESPSSPTASAPWDSRPLLESTGHGLKFRIPMEIPGKIIDHCFGNVDLGHDQTGEWERYQLGCAFRKQPARGDLFDSVRKPSDIPKPERAR